MTVSIKFIQSNQIYKNIFTNAGDSIVSQNISTVAKTRHFAAGIVADVLATAFIIFTLIKTFDILDAADAPDISDAPDASNAVDFNDAVIGCWCLQFRQSVAILVYNKMIMNSERYLAPL